MRKRAELLSHIHNTNTQYNYLAIGKNLKYKHNRELVNGRFADSSVQKNVDLDVQVIGFYDKQLSHAKVHDYHSYMLLKSVPGIGDIISLGYLI